MQAGKLRQRVTIQVNAGSLDAFGEEQNDYSDLRTVWASIDALDGLEVANGPAFVAESTHLVKTRFQPDLAIVPKRHRLKKGNRILDINAALDPDGRRRELHLYVKE